MLLVTIIPQLIGVVGAPRALAPASMVATPATTMAMAEVRVFTVSSYSTIACTWQQYACSMQNASSSEAAVQRRRAIQVALSVDSSAGRSE
jgi:hypothetical protein